MTLLKGWNEFLLHHVSAVMVVLTLEEINHQSILMGFYRIDYRSISFRFSNSVAGSDSASDGRIWLDQRNRNLLTD